MARRILTARFAAWVLVATLAAGSSGCKLLMASIWLLDGPHKVDADFKTYTKRSMAEKGKKVVILCSAPDQVGDSSPLEIDLLTEVSRRMQNHGINVADPNEVAGWLDDNPDELTEQDLVAVGRKFGATYVVHIDLDSFSYKSDSSPGLFQGESQAHISVLALPDGKNSGRNFKLIYHKEFSSTYPVHQPMSAEQISAATFRKKYIDRMSDELSRLFYDHQMGEEF